MIRIFPDFSVQVTASGGGGPGVGGGGGGGMVTGPQVGRLPGATNGTPQSVQGITAYQQRYVWSCRKRKKKRPVASNSVEKEFNLKCRNVCINTLKEILIFPNSFLIISS